MWTKWFDLDTEKDQGDYETLLKIQKQCPESICEEPIGVEGRIVGTSDAYSSANYFSQSIELNAKVGLICENEEQNCYNYEVRFCCPKGYVNLV